MFKRPHHSSINEENTLLDIFTVFKISEDMRICQDLSLQHFDRCFLMLGNGDLPIAELPDSIHIPPEKSGKDISRH